MATDLDPIPLLRREWVWTRRALELGLLDHADGLSLHLYNNCRGPDERRPSEQIERVRKLVELVDEFRPGQAFPLYVTEAGWPNPARGCGFTEEQQISYISQFLVSIAQFPSVKGVWIYELKDSGSNRDDLEHNFGLLNFDYSPKPYLCGFTQTRDLLTAARFEAISETEEGGTRVDLRKGDSQVSVVWLPTAEQGIDYIVEPGKRARFLCEDASFGAGQTVELKERPLVIEPAS